MRDIIKRLKLIETCIALEDYALIAMQLPVLKALDGDHETNTIIAYLEAEEFVAAQKAIARLLASQHGLVVFEDYEVGAIRLELRQHEQKLQSLLTEHHEAQNKIDDFNREYHLNLGDLLVRILSLKEDIAAQTVANELKHYRFLLEQFDALTEKIAAEKIVCDSIYRQLSDVSLFDASYDALIDENLTLLQRIIQYEKERESIRQALLSEYEKVKTQEAYHEYEEAKDSADEFEQETVEIKQSIVETLDDKQKKHVKTLYRKACKLVHPDIVSDELRGKAHDFMVEVNAAYQAQDIARLESVLFQIENGGEMPSFSAALSNRDALLNKIAEIKVKCASVQEELSQLESSEGYLAILSLGESWDDYFVQKKRELEALVKELEHTLAALMDEPLDEVFSFDDWFDEFSNETEELDGGNKNCASSLHNVTGFWRQGHWRGDVWVRGHWVRDHVRFR